MCGIAGFISSQPFKNNSVEHVLGQMGDSIYTRGPDSSGIWFDANVELGFVHRRLAILELSPAGHQPMLDVQSGSSLIFNGEIYNHLEIRKALDSELIGHRWNGHSDTETLLVAFIAWGVQKTLKMAIGMFALAFWDARSRTLTLARDRFGEKPLYFGWAHSENGFKASGFVFGSELQALKCFPGFNNPVNFNALGEYFKFLYVPEPLSIYQGVHKLAPGSIVVVSPEALEHPELNCSYDELGTLKGLEFQEYFNYKSLVVEALSNPYETDELALSDLEFSLEQAVNAQCLSDVPLGAFLSGGVDSSTIVALMQKNSASRVRTFTVGFDVPGYDESQFAKDVASHLGTAHQELRVTSQEARDVIPQISQMYSEPFADSSQIPTHLVCRSAKSEVTVALSGDAGDEMFGGYNRYMWLPRVWRKVRPFGAGGRNLISGALLGVSAGTWDALFSVKNRGADGVTRVGEKLHKLGTRLLDVKSEEDFYWSLVSEHREPSRLLHAYGSNLIAPDYLNEVDGILGPFWQKMMYADAKSYLPGDILCKVDRAAMRISLETRTPFLDPRVVSAAWRLPEHLKISDGVGKVALRQILYKYVPKGLIERPKSGFAIPLGDWLRKDLRSWCEDLLLKDRLEAAGLCPDYVHRLWRRHTEQDIDAASAVWPILVYLDWNAG